jgi:hypothetical protein
MVNKSVLVLFGFVLIIGAIIAWVIYSQTPSPTITSFEECVAAGYPVLESYPEQCATPDGTTFTRVIPDGEEALPPLPSDNGIDPDEAVFCTMDALECPDGTYVGRIPPTCEFAPCPGN